VGFAMFEIVTVEFDASPKSIQGRFRRWVLPNEVSGGDWSTSSIRTVRMVQ
jgi:hypothetical protein